jgi:hypothetical protein
VAAEDWEERLAGVVHAPKSSASWERASNAPISAWGPEVSRARE